MTAPGGPSASPPSGERVRRSARSVAVPVGRWSSAWCPSSSSPWRSAPGCVAWRRHEHGEACDLVRASVEEAATPRWGRAPRGRRHGRLLRPGLRPERPPASWPTAFAHGRATVRVDGFAGSGFTGSAFCDGEDYGTRARALAGGDDELLVIQGGLNDVNADPRAIESAAVAVVRPRRRGGRRSARRPSATSRSPGDRCRAGPGRRGGGGRLRLDDRPGTTSAYLPDRLHLTPEVTRLRHPGRRRAPRRRHPALTRPGARAGRILGTVRPAPPRSTP